MAGYASMTPKRVRSTLQSAQASAMAKSCSPGQAPASKRAGSKIATAIGTASAARYGYASTSPRNVTKPLRNAQGKAAGGKIARAMNRSQPSGGVGSTASYSNHPKTISGTFTKRRGIKTHTPDTITGTKTAAM